MRLFLFLNGLLKRRRRLGVGAIGLGSRVGLSSDAHRHHDVLVIGSIGHRYQRARIGVAESEQDAFSREVMQNIQQISDVESDVERFALVFDLELLFRFFLFAVGADNLELIGAQNHSDTAKFFIRKNRGALQRLQQLGPRELDLLRVPRRNDAVIVRKLSVDHLAHQFNVGEAESHLVSKQIDGQLVVAFLQKLADLQNGLARKNDFLACVASGNREARVRQPVAIGCHCLQRALVHDQQHAVEVIADVLLRHRELGELEQTAKIALRQLDGLLLFLRKVDARIIDRRQRLQVKSRAICAHGHLARRGIDIQRRTVGKRPQQILEFACSYCYRLVLFSREITVRSDLHFEIRRCHKQPYVFLLDENIGEYRQRLPALNDARNSLQRLQQCVSWYLL